MDFDDLQALMWAYEHGSLKAASRETGVPRSTLRRRLERLEASLGEATFLAGHEGISLTAAGRTLVEDGGELLAARERLIKRARGAQVPQDTLHLLVQIGLPPRALSAALGMLLQAMPGLRVHVDFAVDPSSRKGEAFDAIVHFGENPVVRQGFTRTLFRVGFRVMASAGYLAERGTPQTPADLDAHAILHLLGSEPLWPCLEGGTVEISPLHVCSDLYLLGHLAGQGLGLALLPVGGLLVEESIAALVPVLTDHIGEERSLRVDMPVPSAPGSVVSALIRVAEALGQEVHEIQGGVTGSAS